MNREQREREDIEPARRLAPAAPGRAPVGRRQHEVSPNCKRAAAIALLFAALASIAAAHELGTIRTFATFRKDGTYRIEVIVDREHLPPGFAASATAAGGRIGNLSPELESAPVGRILAEVLAHSEARFDGKRVEPRAEWENPDPDGAEPTLVLTGPIPGGARDFSWSNALPLGSYLLTLRTEGVAEAERQWVEGGQRSRPFELRREIVPPTTIDVVRQYLTLGFTHILPKGVDHILFVLGVFLLSQRWKPILLQVTAFTLAHTLTLGLTIYGIVSLPSAVVEPLIALSIVYVAIENLRTSELTSGRLALVFAFGLIHGMGFAGVLSQLGLPRSQFLPALVSFNLGVEAGQLTVILGAFLFLRAPWGRRPWYRQRVVVPLSLAIAAIGAYWAFQRIG